MSGRTWWVLLLAIAVLPLMLSSDSLWIDEGVTAYRGTQPTFSTWLHNLIEDPDGDSLQPLGMFFLWLTDHLIGTSEWQMRSVNLLWGLLSLSFIWRAGKNLNIGWLPLLLVIQPFFWFHMNEARPYALENTCGTALLYGFTIFLRDHARGLRWSVALTLSAVAFCYATALAPLFLLSLTIVIVIVLWRNHWKVEAKALLPPIGGLLATVPVALFYLQVLRHGEKGAKLWNVDARYVGYVAYELGGASGLGPPLEQLRILARNLSHFAGHREIFLQFICGVLLLFLIGLMFLALGLLDKTGSRKRLALILIGPVCLEVTIFFIFGLALHKNLWPRHLNVAFPFYVAALGVAIAWVFRSGNFFTKLSAVLLIFLLCWSSLRLRYSPMYAKDDYRWATKTALQKSREGHVVWWVANKFAANYYGLKLVTSAPKTGEAFSPEQAHWNGPASDGDAKPLPNDIFVSRADVHDSNGAVGALIKEGAYHLQDTHPSFEWWVR